MILRCYYYLKYNRLILNRKRFLYEYNNNFKQKRVNAYALKKREPDLSKKSMKIKKAQM